LIFSFLKVRNSVERQVRFLIQLRKEVIEMSIYSELNQEQQDEVNTHIKLLFHLSHNSSPLRERLMEISQESKSNLIKLKIFSGGA